MEPQARRRLSFKSVIFFHCDFGRGRFYSCEAYIEWLNELLEWAKTTLTPGIRGKETQSYFSSILLRLNMTGKVPVMGVYMEKQDAHGSSGAKPLAGRPSSLESEKLSQRVVDAILSMWALPEDELNFTQIHQGLVRRGIVPKREYRYKTDRILKKLCEMKLINKIGRGRYRLNVEPDEFKIFDYLQTLRQRRETSQFRVGGFLWSLSQLYFLGMPQSVLKYEDAKYALEILNVRIAQLFEALRILAKEVETREKEAVESKLLLLPSQVVRELLLELIPYYLGCKAGMDSDGLPLDELNMVLPKMIHSLPEEVTPQSPTRKEIIMEYFDVINRLMNKREEEQENEEKLFEVFQEKPEDFALIVIRPEHLIDESGSQKREIKNELVEWSSENKSALYIASSLLLFDKENVLAVLDTYGRKYLGKQKWKETRELYEKLHASDQVAGIISDFDFYNGKEKVEAKKYIQELVDEYKVKTIITYLPFSHCSLNFIIPTPRKEKILQEFFPQLPIETMHEWLNDGAILATKISEEKIADLAKHWKVDTQNRRGNREI